MIIIRKNEDEIPKAKMGFCEPWEKEIYDILERENIDNIVIIHMEDDEVDFIGEYETMQKVWQ